MVDAIYIHIPFCLKKCAYCDFLSFKMSDKERERYVDALIREIELYPKFEYTTIYFGGGTPSLLSVREVERILSVLNIGERCEITLEVNPKTVDLDRLKLLKKAGINRLSLGIQTFNSKHLKRLGRLHSVEEAVEAYKLAREAGFENISIDLMFSLPEQSLLELKDDLFLLFSLKPEHFSIYSLIWEEGTEFFEKLKKGIYTETDNDLEADMYEYIIDESKKQGYNHYEISNFSYPNKESLHNSKYWENKQYIGVGLGASGYFKNKRYKNDLNFNKYYDRICQGEKPISEIEIIDEETKLIYEYILGLRLINKGIKPKGKYLEICKTLEEENYLTKVSERYRLTKKGIVLANDVFERFL